MTKLHLGFFGAGLCSYQSGVNSDLAESPNADVCHKNIVM